MKSLASRFDPTKKKCTRCWQTGKKILHYTDPCPKCEGKGKTGRFGSCKECKGATIQVVERRVKICKKCQGQGFTRVSKESVLKGAGKKALKKGAKMAVSAAMGGDGDGGGDDGGGDDGGDDSEEDEDEDESDGEDDGEDEEEEEEEKKKKGKKEKKPVFKDKAKLAKLGYKYDTKKKYTKAITEIEAEMVKNGLKVPVIPDPSTLAAAKDAKDSKDGTDGKDGDDAGDTGDAGDAGGGDEVVGDRDESKQGSNGSKGSGQDLGKICGTIINDLKGVIGKNDGSGDVSKINEEFNGIVKRLDELKVLLDKNGKNSKKTKKKKSKKKKKDKKDKDDEKDEEEDDGGDEEEDGSDDEGSDDEGSDEEDGGDEEED